jgi:hypothetical protein
MGGRSITSPFLAPVEGAGGPESTGDLLAIWTLPITIAVSATPARTAPALAASCDRVDRIEITLQALHVRT